jgi:hypothetical protein
MKRADSAGPEQVEAFLSRFPEDFREQVELPQVDGTKTDKSTWFEPGEGILPAPLSQEHIDKTMNMPEERKEILRAKMKANPK